MKKILLVVLLAGFLVSCEKENREELVVDFESVDLPETGFYDGSDKTGEDLGFGMYVKTIDVDGFGFINNFIVTEWGGYEYSSWSGFAISSLTDTATVGYGNQYSVMAGEGAEGSEKFALAFDSAAVVLPADNFYYPKSVMLTNTTYAYKDIQEGGFFTKKFVDGDWFKVIIKGYLGAVETGTVEYYLADFRDNKSFIAKEWTEVDLKSLGEVTFLTFSFDSTDKGDFGVNTPKYVCLDNLVVEYDEILK